MKQTATSIVTDGVSLITLDNPPVNALSASLRRGLQAELEKAFDDEAVAPSSCSARDEPSLPART